MKTILVTGAAGFIGSNLVDRLLAEGGWQVIAVDHFSDGYDPAIKRANIRRCLAHPDYRLVEADIRDFDALDRAIGSGTPDCIVHLAARGGVEPSIASPRLYAATNVDGTLNLLELARLRGVGQFIFGSSSSVYGANTKLPFSENDPVCAPISPYAATKAAGELLCHAYAHLHDMRAICLRFFTVYGPRQRPDLVVSKFATLIDAGQPVPVFGDGTAQRDFTFIDDIVAGIRCAVGYNQSRYEVFNLGESCVVELRHLITLLEESLGRPAAIEWFPPKPADVRRTVADISKARRLLGYNPQTQVAAGIPKFVEWFRATDRGMS